MYRSWKWLLPLLLFFILPGSLSAQEADVLTGRVIGVDGAPIVGARVEAISIETEIARSVLTGSNGRYMILFPDGTGRYLIRISFIGMRTEVRVVAREGFEELLVTDVTLSPAPIRVEGLVAEGRLDPSAEANAGEQTSEYTQDLIAQLPLEDLDPSTLALLDAGIMATEADSMTGAMGFSVAGMSDLLNQIVVDGVEVGEGGMSVPEEGIRRAQVTTSTFDVSRGGFAGGQVRMTTARGNNRRAMSLSYRLDDDALQMNSGAITNGFTRHNIGGSIGGPIIRNRLFYNTSFQVGRNIYQRYALAGNDPLAALRSGVHGDSIARFLSIYEDVYGFTSEGKIGRYNQLNNDLRVQGRVDWNLRRSQGQSHTLSARFNLNINSQDSTRINSLDMAEHGGEMERNNRLGALTFTSRLGGGWTNRLGVSYGHSWSDALPYLAMPEGRVRITSDFDDGTRGTRNLIFGGNRSMPSESYSKNLQISDELAVLLPIGSSLHRFKVGGSLQRVVSTRRTTNNIFGVFTYRSLEDFEQNRPDRYERALTEFETETGRLNAGFYIGDTWRITNPLELTMGLRWDFSSLDRRPEYNPKVEELFGRRTDVATRAWGFSPRLGFNYRLNKPGEAPRSLNGGFGYFRGRAPTNIYSAAIRQTGLPNSDGRLICIGDAVPIPDWQNYVDNLDGIPEECLDGSPPTQSVNAADVTLINPDQALPSSLRAELGYRTRLPFNLDGEFRYGYSRGIGLWGYRDLNLDTSQSFVLSNEGRIFYGDPDAIVRSTGNVSPATSRLHGDYRFVYDVNSELASSTHQFTTRLSGMITDKAMIRLNYALGFSREEYTGYRGGTTGGDPNEKAWSTANNDRRHSITAAISYAFTPEFQVSVTGRSTSGAPFTPIVNRDVNGDGSRNDRAFIFDPANAPTPEVAEGMRRLLNNVPGRVRDCLESQMGSIADRNSCRNGWAHTLNFRASLRPNLPRLQRRMTISIDGRNTLTGLDQLFHGSRNMKGWGEGRRADAVLLEVHGFDATSKNFIYEVNEGFGQTRRGPNAFRRPFSLTVSARVTLGGNPNLANRGFGAYGRGSRGSSRGGATANNNSGGRAGSDARLSLTEFGDFAGILRGAMRGRTVDPDSALTVALYNPVPRILAHRDSIGMTEEQTQKIAAVSDSMARELGRQKDALVPLIGRYLSTMRENSSSGAPRGGLTDQLLEQMRAELKPIAEKTRDDRRKVLQEVSTLLTPEQWSQLPEFIRAGRRSAGRGSFNAVGALDRALANPIPLILQMGETLELSEAQVAKVREISDKLQLQLNKRREELGSRFDNRTPQEQSRIFREMRPELNSARRQITNALREVEKSLTKEQWEKVPERVRNPFQSNRQRGQQRQRPAT